MHVDLLNEEQKSVLELLSSLDIVNDFYLAGGTALALQYGHRESVDFDFFKEQSFDVKRVIDVFSQIEKIDVRVEKEDTLYFLLNNISCSFFKYPYPLLFDTLDLNGAVKLASVGDIAAMKISAISTRGTKRDFVDLFFICQRDYSLSEVISLFEEKFKMVTYDMYHTYKSLMYFVDAEKDAISKMYEKANWNEIKTFFTKEVNKLME